jgi:hypothetical protein
MIRRIAFFLVWACALFAALAPAAGAAVRGPDGFYRTGSAIQTANHWPFTIQVFAIWHETRELPPSKDRRAMIDLDTDKRFSLRMLRELDAERLRGGLREGLCRNGFTDDAIVGRFLAPLQGTLANGRAIWIEYDANAKRTRLVVDGGGSSSVDGAEFMRATWSVWFGKSSPSGLGDELLGEM